MTDENTASNGHANGHAPDGYSVLQDLDSAVGRSAKTKTHKQNQNDSTSAPAASPAQPANGFGFTFESKLVRDGWLDDECASSPGTSAPSSRSAMCQTRSIA
jgi:hypothetical protein